MKISKKTLQLALPLLAMGLMVASPAHAEDFFDRLQAITNKLPVIKTAAIYIFFLAGVFALGWGITEIIKKSKARGGDDISWLNIGLKVLAGALLVAFTATTDIFTQTFVGTSGSSSNTTNIQ
jgi:hypothetical protein